MNYQQNPGVTARNEVLDAVRVYNKTSAFTDRRLTDMPTDALQVVPRKFVTLNGVTASRPTSPVTGQFYFDTTLGFPVWFNGSDWVDGQGIVN